MTEQQITSLREYYNKKYGTPKNDNQAIDTLVTIYGDLFNLTPTVEIRDGIAEYYRLIQGRSLPAFLWMVECFHVTSKKDKSKRTFKYCVGMIRSWLKHGFGYIPNGEEDELVEFFQEITGYKVTPDARRVLQKLMGKYGLIKVTRMINGLRGHTDKSLLMMLQLESIMDDAFEDAMTEREKELATA